MTKQDDFEETLRYWNTRKDTCDHRDYDEYISILFTIDLLKEFKDLKEALSDFNKVFNHDND